MIISLLIILKKRFNKIFSYIPQFFGFIHIFILYYTIPSIERDLIPIFFWLFYYIISLGYFAIFNKKSLNWILTSQLRKKGFNFPEFHNQISNLKIEDNKKEVIEIILNDIKKEHDIAEFQKNSQILKKFLENNKYYVKEYMIEILIRGNKK